MLTIRPHTVFASAWWDDLQFKSMVQHWANVSLLLYHCSSAGQRIVYLASLHASYIILPGIKGEIICVSVHFQYANVDSGQWPSFSNLFFSVYPHISVFSLSFLTRCHRHVPTAVCKDLNRSKAQLSGRCRSGPQFVAMGLLNKQYIVWTSHYWLGKNIYYGARMIPSICLTSPMLFP